MPPKSTTDGQETRATSEGVDAQNANEFDARHALAGVEGKPFSPAAPRPPEAQPAKPGLDGEDSKSREKTGLISERRNPARDDGVNTANADEATRGQE